MGAAWGRQGRQRARGAALVAVGLLLATTPATTPAARPPAKVATAVAAHARSVDEVRARMSRAPVATAAAAWSGAAATAEVPGEVAIVPPPETFDAPAATAAPPPPTLLNAAGTSSGGTWAVVIGIDDYPGNGSDLRQSVRDANDTDAALAAYGIPADRRVLLRNTQATASVIADSLRWLVSRAGRDATAVFFYAGHVRKIGKGAEAIVAADGKLVTDRTMADLLRPLAARQTWIALASCYAGGFDEVLAPGRILTGAAGANSLAYENAAYGNSYLVEYMVERAMRQGHAAKSVEQSFGWAYESLRRDHPNRLPVQYDRLDGELQLGNPPAPAPKQQPSSTQPQQPPKRDQPPPPPPEDDDCVLTIGNVVGCDDRTIGG